MGKEEMFAMVNSLCGNKKYFTKEEIYEILVKICRNDEKKTRIKQYYAKSPERVVSYSSGTRRCSCGCNCYHKEYDVESKKMYSVCNSCDSDLGVYVDGVDEALASGVWK